jgi:hypothetical protein
MPFDFLIVNQPTPPWTNTIIGPLIGAFFGVLLGFGVNELWRKRLENNRKSFFRKLLLHEVKYSIELLNGMVNLVPIDAWNSLVNSGDIALFKDKAIELNDVYFKIQNYNYEAKRVRDAEEHDQMEGLSLKNGEECERSVELKENLKKTTDDLLKELKKLENLLCL